MANFLGCCPVDNFELVVPVVTADDCALVLSPILVPGTYEIVLSEPTGFTGTAHVDCGYNSSGQTFIGDSGCSANHVNGPMDYPPFDQRSYDILQSPGTDTVDQPMIVIGLCPTGQFVFRAYSDDESTGTVKLTGTYISGP